MLVYDDYPGTPGAELATVNDLDLVGGVDDATKVTGNFKDRRDYRNTAEHVIIDNAKNGQQVYFVVRARQVPQGPQAYALAISGKFNKISDQKSCNFQWTDNFELARDTDFFPYG